eukprot:jgi/Mesvir1/24967/Mv16937-RA.1
MDRLEVLRDEVPAWTEAEACEKWLKALGPKAAMIPQPRFGCHWDLAQLCTEVHAFNRRQARGLPDLVELVRQEVAQAHKGNRVGGAQSGGGGSSGGRGGPSSRQFGSQADKPASAGGDNTASSSTGQATADPHNLGMLDLREARSREAGLPSPVQEGARGWNARPCSSSGRVQVPSGHQDRASTCSGHGGGRQHANRAGS